MFGIGRNEFSLENRTTITDIYYIKDLFEEIGSVENRLEDLFDQGYSAYDKIKEELIALVNCYELLKGKTQGQNQSIESSYSFQIEGVRDRINKLLKRAEKLGITIGTNRL
ncbi:MAG: hypothetical protein KAX15_07090 [Candidatus Omnitrophica bacterium]|nr:hypothetical protein [Candidatus Omnitrophota bacterium]